MQVRDKWNQLVFVPMPVLNNRDSNSGSTKAGKREGFNTFNRLVDEPQNVHVIAKLKVASVCANHQHIHRLSCKPCGKCFHTASGLASHSCIAAGGNRQPAIRNTFSSSYSTYSSSSSPTTSRASLSRSRIPMEGVRRSSRVSTVDKNYQEDDDDIEIVGGPEIDKRVAEKGAEKVDKNFSKMTLKAQREAAEAFRNSRDYSTEEEEEQVVKPHKVGRRGRKRKAVVEEDSDSDIEILDSSNKKRFSTDRECISITPISITPMSTTTPISKKLFNNNNNNFSPTNMASWNKKPQEEEQLDSNKQSRDLVQVRNVEVVHNFQAVSFF